jgi:hypothetical protein
MQAQQAQGGGQQPQLQPQGSGPIGGVMGGPGQMGQLMQQPSVNQPMMGGGQPQPQMGGGVGGHMGVGPGGVMMMGGGQGMGPGGPGGGPGGPGGNMGGGMGGPGGFDNGQGRTVLG